MTICAVFGCSTRSEFKDSNISLHKFPRNPALKDAWIKAIRRSGWEPSKYAVVCSLHFEDSCFRHNIKRRELHKEAVPTLFSSYPSYYKNQNTSSRPHLARNAEETATSSSSRTSVAENVIPEITDSDEVVSLKRKLEKCSCLICSCKKILKPPRTFLLLHSEIDIFNIMCLFLHLIENYQFSDILNYAFEKGKCILLGRSSFQ